ncbi:MULTISPECIES: hypothetical protein [Enterococcus]|uniref:Uncharacterized protein n=1 Tax=Enterococcus faecium TaxID=1352 RepID=A0AB37HZ99_ENTFC|nr:MULTISPECIES: hypothetical protein [Enterococcus]EGP5619866.1 hypothetical protein [Enterococcus faecium]EME8088287.1 hypothetical protein [Enterococcus faecium]EMF0485734.1 hypothetical protein [Enterococcus hirae]PQH00131.1 hypothetical protein CUS52_02980 [Enterococcus faecium]RBT00321.1 hypothetical protein EA84_02669 [Enterococcus faecium]
MYTDWKWQYQFLVMRKWLLALLKLSLVASYFYCCYLGWQQLKELSMTSFQLSNVNGITLQEIVETMLYLLVAMLLVYCFFSWYFGNSIRIILKNCIGIFGRFYGIGLFGLFVLSTEDLIESISKLLISYCLYIMYRQYNRIHDEELVKRLKMEGVDLSDTNIRYGLKHREKYFPRHLSNMILDKLELTERTIKSRYLSTLITEEVTIFIYKVKWSPYPLKITTGFQSPTVESEVMRVAVKGAEENEWNK